jgi:hypothetical protein
MSLLYDPVTHEPRQTLHALLADKYENYAAFWQHLLSRYEFAERRWICGTLQGVKYRQPPTNDKRISVLLVHEECERPYGSSQSRRDCTERVRQACAEVCRSKFRAQLVVWALATEGTKAKIWAYAEEHPRLNLIHGDAWLDADDAVDGPKLHAIFALMKHNVVPEDDVSTTAPPPSTSSVLFGCEKVAVAIGSADRLSYQKLAPDDWKDWGPITRAVKNGKFVYLSTKDKVYVDVDDVVPLPSRGPDRYQQDALPSRGGDRYQEYGRQSIRG